MVCHVAIWGLGAYVKSQSDSTKDDSSEDI